MELEQISDSLRGDKILYTGLGLLVLTGLVLALQMEFQDPAGGDQISVTLNIDDGSDWTTENVQVANNSSVFDALNSSHEVEYREYDMGYFVTSIDGTGGEEDYSWLFFVNGESAQVSVDNYILDDQDNVTFRYLHNNETSQYVE
jgi:hypothetical protein